MTCTAVSPGHSVLTDPGPLCAGEEAGLTCNITGGTLLAWDYDSGRLIAIDPVNSPLLAPLTIMPGTIAFTVSMLMPTTPHLQSQISFVAVEEMNSRTLTCSGTSSVVVEDTITLQIVRGEHISRTEND